MTDRIEKHIGALNETDALIMQFITKNKEACSNFTIETLAAKCSVSRTTIMRFAQKIGFSGYSEMKSHMKWSCRQKPKFTENAVEDVCNDYHKLIDVIKETNCDDICKLLHDSRRVYVYGTGAVQTNVARDFQRCCLSAHLPVIHIEGTRNETNLLLEVISEKDVVFIISFSGESETGVEFARHLKIKNVPVVSLTKFKNNTLAQLSRYNLYVNTSVVNSAYPTFYETTGLFFITVEMLLIKYILFSQNLM